MNAGSRSPSVTRPRGPGRAQFLLLAVLFLTPFVAAWVLYFYFPQHRPSGTTNYGELVTPLHALPRSVWLAPDGSATDTSELLGKWTLMQVVSGPCDAPCRERVLLSRQLRTSLAGDRDRLRRVLLVQPAAALPDLQQSLLADHPDLLLRRPQNGAIDAAFFSGQGANALYLIDPLGNCLMVYPDRGTQADFKGLQKDFKRLLSLSQIG